MSPDEIIFRVKQQTRNRVETLRWKMSGGNGSTQTLFVPSAIANWDAQKYPFPVPEVQFFGLTESPEVLQTAFNNYFSEKTPAIIQQADALLQHRFHFLGLDVQLPDPIQWNQNPQTGANYPLRHFSQMDTFNTEKYGDVKYVWELNRHQFFIEVAKAYLLTGEEKYAEKIWQWLESWFNQVPHKIGINHTSVLEHSVRIFSWIWAYYFTKDSPVWNSDRRAELAKQLLLQGEIIEENLSYFYSPYNHLIGELAALAFLGTVYSHSPKMHRWRDHYWREMETQLEKQFRADGFTVEQASYYHHFTLGFYLQTAQLRKKNGLPVSPKVWETLERALEFPMHLTRPDGQLPMLGDIDSARSIYFYRPASKWNLRPFLSLGAAIFQRADMKFVAAEPVEELLWLLGVDGVEVFVNQRISPPEAASRYFRESGYFVMRDGWQKNSSYCLFDCGEIAHGVHKDETPSAAHGHADILSFELCLEGQPLVIDPGFHTYFGDLDWHRYFRDTRGHNAITVNGCGQAAHENRIGWSRVSSPRMEHWLSTPELDFACGSIDRFSQLGKNAFHRRFLLFSKAQGFLIFDEVLGDADTPVKVESSLHFHPGKLAIQDQKLSFNNCPVAHFAAPETASFSIETGGANPDKGWIARGYGEKSPAPVLRISNEQKLPFQMGMLFTLGCICKGVTEFSLQKYSQDIYMIRIALTDCISRIYFNSQRKKFTLKSENSFETDALCAIEMHRENRAPELRFLKTNHLFSKAFDVTVHPGGEDVNGVKVRLNSADDATVEIL